MDNISLTNAGDVDIVRYEPQGVCSKLMQIRIKDDIILDIEIIGGCSGNLQGISRLVKGADIHEISKKLSGIPCGSRPTSCPDQLSRALSAYIELKTQTVRA